MTTNIGKETGLMTPESECIKGPDINLGNLGHIGPNKIALCLVMVKCLVSPESG